MASREATPTQSIVSSPSSLIGPGASEWRRFAVDDLQLSPALCLPSETVLSAALREASLRDFTILPVISHSRSLIGYLDVPAASSRLEKNELEPDATVGDSMRKFQRSMPYQVITPDTDLRTLEEFFTVNSFAIITDASRKFVLGVCTREDLARFVERWAPNKAHHAS